MKIKFARVLIVLCFFPSVVWGQNFRVQLPPGYNKIALSDAVEPGTEGSPYLNETFSPGILKLWQGKIIKGLPYRYDVLHNEMQYLFDQKTYIIGNPDSIQEISFEGRTFIYHDFSDRIKEEKGYYEILVSGNVMLVAKHFVQIEKANYNVALNTGNKNNKLHLKEKYYLLDHGNIVLIDKKGKNVASMLSAHSNELKQFIQQNDLSYKSKQDIIKIIQYYNSL